MIQIIISFQEDFNKSILFNIRFKVWYFYECNNIYFNNQEEIWVGDYIKKYI